MLAASALPFALTVGGRLYLDGWSLTHCGYMGAIFLYVLYRIGCSYYLDLLNLPAYPPAAYPSISGALLLRVVVRYAVVTLCAAGGYGLLASLLQYTELGAWDGLREYSRAIPQTTSNRRYASLFAFPAARPVPSRAGVLVAGWICAGVLVFLLWAWVKPRILPPDNHVRGRRMLTFHEAAKRAPTCRPISGPLLPWGGLLLPWEARGSHAFLVGTTGAGKTIVMRLHMQVTLPRIGLHADERALVYDPKLDFLSHLHGMELNAPIKILNPFDQRSVAWDIAADCTSPSTAYQMAEIMIPEEQGQNRYFSDAARHLLSGAMHSYLTVSPGAWNLRDVVLAMKDTERLTEILGRCPQTAWLVAKYLRDTRSAAEVGATIASRLAPLEPIAACWSHAPQKVSLEDWIHGDYILLLGIDEANRAMLDTINRVLFKRATELILAGSESSRRTTWIYLDEVREAGKLAGLSSLLTRGRSKGAAVVMNFQDIEGMRDAYGDKVAHELLGQCGQVSILRLHSPATAQWASELLGEYELREMEVSETTGASGNSTTVRESIVKRHCVLPSEFLSLPVSSPADGVHGYHISAHAGAWFVKLPGAWIQRCLKLPRGDVANFLPRPAAQQLLLPWNNTDLARLKLSRPVETPTGANSALATPAPVGVTPRGAAASPAPRLQVLQPVVHASSCNGKRSS